MMVGRIYFQILSLLVVSIPILGSRRIIIQPLDFQVEDAAETYVQKIAQLETDGRHIFIRSENLYLIKIDAQGKFLGKVADFGLGSHKDQLITSFSLFQDTIATTHSKNSVFLFKGNDLLSYFNGNSYDSRFTAPYHNGNAFGFDGQRVILPIKPETGYLAGVFDGNGTILKKVGKRRSYPDEIKLGNDALNATFWVKGENFWFCLFKFRPLVHKYDKDFRLVQQFEIEGDEINECEEILFGKKDHPQKTFLKPPPHFSDVKVFGDNLFVLCRGALYQIDSNSGQTVQRYYFFGRGDDFSLVPPGERLHLFNFAILRNGKVVLSHPSMPWNHDLWVADLNLAGS